MGADIKQLRTRIKSVDSTLHLTKAMGLVASSKIRRATDSMNKGREYAEALEETIAVLSNFEECKRTPYMAKREGGRMCLIVVAGDRGLAGGYNANIFRLLREYPDVKILYPIHKNPLVRAVAQEEFRDCGNIRISEPLDVIECHNIMARSFLILTDSGGIQEEAPSLGKPVLVMRDTTEREEGVRVGTVKLVGTEEEIVYENVKMLLDDPTVYRAMSETKNPYGDGFACKRIADILEMQLEKI